MRLEIAGVGFGVSETEGLGFISGVGEVLMLDPLFDTPLFVNRDMSQPSTLTIRTLISKRLLMSRTRRHSVNHH